MKFCERLNAYMTELSCTAKDLSSLSGVSTATFSRYRSGERLPEYGSAGFDNLCNAIARIAEGIPTVDITATSVKEEFLKCEDFISTDKELLRQNFNTLITSLNISLSRLSKHTSYDTSTVFRIRNGTRRPSNPEQFADVISTFIARELKSPSEILAISELIGCEADDIADQSVRYKKLKSWLLESRGKKAENNSVSKFLNKLNEFDLNEYIKSIHFDELKVPSMPFQIPTSKTYFGLKEMMSSELDFLKATVLSKSNEPVTMYSDMPIGEMANDKDFAKKWMFGMAMMLKKGLHLNQIHNLDRSFEDMMLGLESWIPMYMTGQISPYYFKGIQNNAFLHLLKVSGAAALSGEAVTGYHSDGKYYLTKQKKEIEYYQKRADELLSNAYPLMNIYLSENSNELNAFLLSDSHKAGKRRSILSTLPLYTMEESLLDSILKRNGIEDEEAERIKECAAAMRSRTGTVLKDNLIEDEISEIKEDKFCEKPPSVDLSEIFFEKQISYTYEEYCEHLKSTEEFAKNHLNYSFEITKSHAFCNLQILMHEGSWAMVSKGKSPVIHFVIHHPKLRGAIEKFIPPVVEE